MHKFVSLEIKKILLPCTLIAILLVAANCIIAFASKDSYVFYRNIELWEQSNEVFSFIYAALASVPICWVVYYERKNNYIVYINHCIKTEAIIATMKMVGLNPDDKTKVKNYSMGMKQKLGIAQAIMENQDIIILDEPFNALDYQTNNDIKAIIKNLQKEQRTILITSQNFQDIEELCSEIYIINNAHLEKLTDDMRKFYSNRTD